MGARSCLPGEPGREALSGPHFHSLFGALSRSPSGNSPALPTHSRLTSRPLGRRHSPACWASAPSPASLSPLGSVHPLPPAQLQLGGWDGWLVGFCFPGASFFSPSASSVAPLVPSLCPAPCPPFVGPLALLSGELLGGSSLPLASAPPSLQPPSRPSYRLLLPTLPPLHRE